MKLSISIADALLPRLDERDLGKGRSEVIQRMILRYLALVRAGAHQAPPHPRDVGAIAEAITQQLGGDRAAALTTDDPLGQAVLLDAAELQLAQSRREE